MCSELLNEYQKIWDWLKGFYGTTLRGDQYLISFERHATAKAFIRPNEFGEGKHGLYLNPDHCNRSNEEIIATLVHEFCHSIEISDRGYQGKYHRKVWAEDMHKIGLKTLNCDIEFSPGNTPFTTGWNVTHNLTNEFRAIIAQIPNFKKPLQLNFEQKPKYKGKLRYRCSNPKCEYSVQVWGKQNLLLYCGFCSEPDELVTLVVKE